MEYRGYNSQQAVLYTRQASHSKQFLSSSQYDFLYRVESYFLYREEDDVLFCAVHDDAMGEEYGASVTVSHFAKVLEG